MHVFIHVHVFCARLLTVTLNKIVSEYVEHYTHVHNHYIPVKPPEHDEQNNANRI